MRKQKSAARFFGRQLISLNLLFPAIEYSAERTDSERKNGKAFSLYPFRRRRLSSGKMAGALFFCLSSPLPRSFSFAFA